jgi:hypothetical protein
VYCQAATASGVGTVGTRRSREPLPPQAPIPPPLLAEVRQALEEALVAGASPEAIVSPGQARMVDGWSDYSGCWADVYDDDHEEMQACEANPDPSSALGLSADYAVSRLQYLVN